MYMEDDHQQELVSIHHLKIFKSKIKIFVFYLPLHKRTQ